MPNIDGGKSNLICSTTREPAGTRAPSLGRGNTQPLTLSSVSVSEATKSAVVASVSAMSTTTATVAADAFFAERRAKTFRRMSRSGWSGFCLARRGKYLRQKQAVNMLR